MRLSFGRERGLDGHVVQNASESHRIHPDPAKTVKPRRISDHSRAEPAENSETQTHFGPLPPRFAVEPAGAGAPKAQRAGVRPHWGTLRCIGVGNVARLPALGWARGRWGRQIAYPNGWFPAPMRLVGKRRRRGARSGGYTAGPPGARAREPRAMGCFHSDTDTTDPNFRSATTLCKFYNACKVTVSL